MAYKRLDLWKRYYVNMGDEYANKNGPWVDDPIKDLVQMRRNKKIFSASVSVGTIVSVLKWVSKKLRRRS